MWLGLALELHELGTKLTPITPRWEKAIGTCEKTVKTYQVCLNLDDLMK
jgi:hypothetical protein